MSGKTGGTALLVGLILVAPVVILLNIAAWIWRKFNG